MEERFAISSHGEVKRLLSIAKRHLGYIRKLRSKRIITQGSRGLDHALVASIFSATAIEVGLNLFIGIPVLWVKDEDVRKYFGLLVTRYLRLSVPQKIRFVCEVCPQIKQDSALLERVRALFEYRNRVLHSSPEYTESLGLSDLDLEKLPSPIAEKDLVRCPGLVSRGTSSSEIQEAFQHYQTALDFLSKLHVWREV